MDKKLIFLFAGIAVTLLYYVLRVDLLEALFTSSGFSDQMYNRGLYDTIALVTIAVAWGMAAVFYYVINSVKFSRWYHWLVILILVLAITPVVGYVLNHGVFADNNLLYGPEEVKIQLVNLVYSALIFLAASLGIRGWSSNCRHTPFGQ